MKVGKNFDKVWHNRPGQGRHTRLFRWAGLFIEIYRRKSGSRLSFRKLTSDEKTKTKTEREFSGRRSSINFVTPGGDKRPFFWPSTFFATMRGFGTPRLFSLFDELFRVRRNVRFFKNPTVPFEKWRLSLIFKATVSLAIFYRMALSVSSRTLTLCANFERQFATNRTEQ